MAHTNVHVHNVIQKAKNTFSNLRLTYGSPQWYAHNQWVVYKKGTKQAYDKQPKPEDWKNLSNAEKEKRFHDRELNFQQFLGTTRKNKQVKSGIENKYNQMKEKEKETVENEYGKKTFKDWSDWLNKKYTAYKDDAQNKKYATLRPGYGNKEIRGRDFYSWFIFTRNTPVDKLFHLQPGAATFAEFIDEKLGSPTTAIEDAQKETSGARRNTKPLRKKGTSGLRFI